ncbi:hypothetical protein D3C78_1144810 [compost metagenome]
MLEDQRERADADIFHIVTQQARVGVRNDQADNQDREYVEQQNTPEHLTHCARNVLLRVFRFTGSDTNQFRSLEGETNNHRHANHGRKSPGKRRLANFPVAPARRFRPFKDAHNHRHADNDEDNHGRHFDQGEPVFCLTKTTYGDVVQQENHRQEDGAPDPARRVREPPVHHQLRGHEVNSDSHRPVVPVVPAQRETEAFFYVFLTVSRKGAGDRHVCRQFAQAGHQEVHHQANQHI